MTGIKVVLDPVFDSVCDFIVPVLADNLLAYCPALITLYLEAKKTSGETQQCL